MATKPGCVLGPLDAARMDEWTMGLRHGMETPAWFNANRVAMVDGYATTRVRRVSEVQGARPQNWGRYERDRVIEARNADGMRGLALPTRDAVRVPGYSAQLASDMPVDVWTARVRATADLDGMQAQVAELRGLEAEPPRPEPGVVATPEMIAARAQMTVLQGQEAQIRESVEEFVAEHEAGQLSDQHFAYYMRIFGDRRNAIREELRGLREELASGGDAMQQRADRHGMWQAQQDEAAKVLRGIAGVEGYGMRVGAHTRDQTLRPRLLGGHKLRNDLDMVAAVHTLDALASTVGSMARAATAPGAKAVYRAETARALHVLDAYVHHVFGNDAARDAALAHAGRPFADAVDGEGVVVTVGRSMRSNELIARSGGSLRLAGHLDSLAKARDTKHLLGIAGRWADDAHRGILAKRGHRSTLVQSAAFRYTSALLSGLDSAARNTLGTFAMGGLRGAERAIARTQEEISASRSVKGVARGVAMAAKETAAGGLAWLGAFTEGVQLTADLVRLSHGQPGGAGRAAAKARVEGKSQEYMAEEFLASTKLDMDERATMQGLPESVMDLAAGSKMEPLARGLNTGIDVVAGWGQHLVFSTDVVARTMSYRAHLAAEVAREAYGKGLGKTELAELARRLEADDNVRARAMDNAQTNSFMDRAKDVPTSMLLEMKKKQPALAWIVPFVNTLSRITQGSLIRVPVAGEAGARLLSREFRERMADDVGYRRRVRAGQVVGAGLMTTGAMLLQSGRITAYEAGRPDTRGAGFDVNWKPWSARMEGDDGSVSYIPLRWLGPPGWLVMAGAAAMETFNAISDDDPQGHEEAVKAMDALLAPLAELLIDEHWAGSVLQGVEAVAAATEGRMPAFERHARELAVNSVVPMSALLKDVRAVQMGLTRPDPEVSGGMGGPSEDQWEAFNEWWEGTTKEMASLTRGILGKAPEGVYPRRALWDEHPIRSYVPQGGLDRAVLGSVSAMISPAALAYQYDTLAAKEAQRLGWNPPRLSRAERVLVQRRGRALGAHYEVIERTAEEHDHYAMLVGRYFRQLSDRAIGQGGWMQLRAHEQRHRLSSMRNRAMRRAWNEMRERSRFADDIARREQKARDLGDRRLAEEDRRRAAEQQRALEQAAEDG